MFIDLRKSGLNSMNHFVVTKLIFGQNLVRKLRVKGKLISPQYKENILSKVINWDFQKSSIQKNVNRL